MLAELAVMAAIGLVRHNPDEQRPTPAKGRETCVHFWRVPELGEAMVRTVGPAVRWEGSGVESDIPTYKYGGIICRRCRKGRGAYSCPESNAIWPKQWYVNEPSAFTPFDLHVTETWCAGAIWLGQVPWPEWQEGLLGKRGASGEERGAETPFASRPTLFDWVDKLEAKRRPCVPGQWPWDSTLGE